MEIDLTNVSDNQGRPYLKSGVYTIRCIDAEKKVSKQGNEMVEFTYEIVFPDFVGEGENRTYIGGLQLTDWIVLTDKGNSLRKLKALHQAMDLPLHFDDSVVPQYEGKAIKARLVTEGSPVRDENTGEVILKPNGTALTSYNYRVREIIAPAPEHTIPVV
jgi:hypothetical protein